MQCYKFGGSFYKIFALFPYSNGEYCFSKDRGFMSVFHRDMEDTQSLMNSWWSPLDDEILMEIFNDGKVFKPQISNAYDGY